PGPPSPPRHAAAGANALRVKPRSRLSRRTFPLLCQEPCAICVPLTPSNARCRSAPGSNFVLALTDQALARIGIGASRVPRRARGHWRRKLALQRQPKPGTRHVREDRQRGRNGVRKCWVSIRPNDEELLRHMHLLPEWDADDRSKVGEAIERLLALLYADHGLES